MCKKTKRMVARQYDCMAPKYQVVIYHDEIGPRQYGPFSFHVARRVAAVSNRSVTETQERRPAYVVGSTHGDVVTSPEGA